MLPAHPFVPFVERTSMDKWHAPLSVPVRRLGPTTALRAASGHYWPVNFTVPENIALKGRADSGASAQSGRQRLFARAYLNAPFWPDCMTGHGELEPVSIYRFWKSNVRFGHWPSVPAVRFGSMLRR
jgi:hypothetical protein